MYSMTSASLLPWPSSSRVSRRRSTASDALESAMVWFWHTRQRNSEVMRTMRASSAGSAASGAASGPPPPCSDSASHAAATTNAARADLRIELLQQRLDLVAQHL